MRRPYDPCAPSLAWGPREYTARDATRDMLAYMPLTARRDGKDVVIAEGPRMAPRFWRYRMARWLVLALRGCL